MTNYGFSMGALWAIKIGINLSDPVFRGTYHGKHAHEDDLQDVIDRATDAGCRKFMVTGSDLQESQHAVQLARDYRMFLFLLRSPPFSIF